MSHLDAGIGSCSSEPAGHPRQQPVGFGLPTGSPYPVAHGHRLII
jgi:hypothetical protein